jgi:hypothetical protein
VNPFAPAGDLHTATPVFSRVNFADRIVTVSICPFHRREEHLMDKTYREAGGISLSRFLLLSQSPHNCHRQLGHLQAIANMRNFRIRTEKEVSWDHTSLDPTGLHCSVCLVTRSFLPSAHQGVTSPVPPGWWCADLG